MSNKPQKSKKVKLRLQDKTNRKELILGSIFATIIASTPFLFNLYESVPDTKVWDTFLFTYNSEYYESANVVAWTLAGRIAPLMLITIWFFTCRHWWYHALLVPIAMYLYQIIETLNSDLYIIDTKNLILYMLPIMAIVVPSIYLIRAQMFNKLNTVNKSLEELEEEFKLKPKTLWGKVKQYF